jgi:two-component system phosphate regulon sensor histidine kinase PhoR
LYGFLPISLAAFFIHLYFTIIAWFPIEKFLSTHFPDLDVQNSSLLFFWKKIVFENQKNLKELEARLKFYSNIFNHLEEGILIIGEKGKIEFNNLSAEEILNFAGSLTNKYFWEIFQNKEINDQIKLVGQMNQKQMGEYVLHSPIGRTLSYLILPMGDSIHKKSDKLLIILFDVTKVKKLEKIRTDFVANVSHELKSPLGAILGYVETLIDEPDFEEQKRKKYLEVIFKNGNQLNAIIDDLLILSKLESDNKVMYSKFNPGKLIGEIIELYKEKIEEREIQIQTNNIDLTLQMYADKGKIQQLVSNLLDNAIKYSLPGGRIELSLIKQGTFIVFSITDNGIGIPIPEQDRVFERFYRVDKARSGDTPGTGLGLAIVKHIVDLHKGSITLISNRNEGSTFTVSIPENLTQS